MKHSVEDLLATAYDYFPRGLTCEDPEYKQTPELLRQKAARVPASARYEDWRAMLRRLRERFPGVLVDNGSLFLQVATTTDLDRCFTGKIWLPARSPTEKHHELEFLVSFVVPYYVICCVRHVFVSHAGGSPDVEIEKSFDLPADDVAFAQAIAEEIRTSFPDHEPLLPEVGLTVVPEVQAGNKWFGESTIFTCLFSDNW
jgi:hypothetical protein